MNNNFILKLYIVYQLNTWPRYPTSNFTLKNCLFGSVRLTRNVDKSRLTYNGQGIAFDENDLWSFDNDSARNAVIFGVDVSSSSHTNNPKNNFLVLGERPTEGINSIIGTAEKKLILTSVKQMQTFA